MASHLLSSKTKYEQFPITSFLCSHHVQLYICFRVRVIFVSKFYMITYSSLLRKHIHVFQCNQCWSHCSLFSLTAILINCIIHGEFHGVHDRVLWQVTIHWKMMIRRDDHLCHNTVTIHFSWLSRHFCCGCVHQQHHAMVHATSFTYILHVIYRTCEHLVV